MSRLHHAAYRAFRAVDRIAGIFLCAVLRPFKSARAPLPPAERRKILLIKFSLIGDTILLIPAVRAVRAAHPGARITVLCSTLNAAVISSLPYVDDVISVDLASLVDPFAVARLARRLAVAECDLVIDFEQWFRFSALLAFCVAGAARAGFKTAGQHRHWLYDVAVEHENEKHEVLCYADLLAAVNIPCPDTALEWRTPPEAARTAREKLRAAGIGDGQSYCVIHPGSSHWVQKQWPVERYGSLCATLAAASPAKIVVTGSAGEAALVRRVVAAAAHASVIDCAGQLSLFELGAVLAEASFVVCGNTGVLHLACAVGAPAILINGPVSAAKWGPWGCRHRVVEADVACAPCVVLGFEYRCGKRTCMESVTVEEVADACSLFAVRRPL